MDDLKKYRVYMRSKPGFYAQYDGKLDVYAIDENEAVHRALRRLRTTSFPDRTADMWHIEKVERLITSEL